MAKQEANMIELSKLNGDSIVVNERWIETIEELPDTTITVSSGNKFVVLESSKSIMQKIIKWQASIKKAAMGSDKNSKNRK